jgi:threonine/homoserine/homoserine lactone efflux protein
VPEAALPLIFITAFVVALSGALMPGPLLVLTIGEVARRGFWAAPQLILGHAILELTLVAALATGVSKFMESDLTSGIVGLVGGSILVGIGFVTVKSGWQSGTILTPAKQIITRDRKLVLNGILVSISNPYWLIWWVTVGTTYLLWSSKLGIGGVATFFTGHILADFGWYVLVAFIIATGRKFMSHKIYRGLLVICGLALLALGGYFVASGINFLVS